MFTSIPANFGNHFAKAIDQINAPMRRCKEVMSRIVVPQFVPAISLTLSRRAVAAGDTANSNSITRIGEQLAAACEQRINSE